MTEKKQYKYYLQIDFINTHKELTISINTFHDLKEALEHHTILQNAQNCINNYSFYILNLYRYEIDNKYEAIDGTDELIMEIKRGNNIDKIFQNITGTTVRRI